MEQNEHLTTYRYLGLLEPDGPTQSPEKLGPLLSTLNLPCKLDGRVLDKNWIRVLFADESQIKHISLLAKHCGYWLFEYGEIKSL